MGRKRRGPEGADLAGAHEIRQRPDRLRDVGLGIGAVHLVEVDPVRPEPTQAVLDGEHDPAARAAAAVRVGAHRRGELRREHDAVAAAGDCLADDLLGLAGGVHIRRLDEVDAGVERRMDDPRAVGGVAVRPGAEVHAAEAERADADARASEVAHGRARASGRGVTGTPDGLFDHG
jgi:hypothetical protein